MRGDTLRMVYRERNYSERKEVNRQFPGMTWQFRNNATLELITRLGASQIVNNKQHHTTNMAGAASTAATALSALTAAMINIDARIESFQQITRPKSKAKPAFPLSPTTHPKLTPLNLASAGFFHDPTGQDDDEELDDTCKCFLCGLKLSGWDEDDDPYVEHVKRGSCAWAEFVCQPKIHQANGTRWVLVSF